jgi:hypothetical protein
LTPRSPPPPQPPTRCRGRSTRRPSRGSSACSSSSAATARASFPTCHRTGLPPRRGRGRAHPRAGLDQPHQVPPPARPPQRRAAPGQSWLTRRRWTTWTGGSTSC